MELSEVKAKLSTLNIPVAYLRFKTPQTLPYCVYYESGTDIKGADYYNLYRDVTINIELYCEKKQPQLERQLENLFRDREITKTPDIYLKDEDMYMTVFSFDTIQYIEED